MGSVQQPSLFVSHGAPTLPFEDHDAVPFLKGLSSVYTPPKAILVVSAHWETDKPMLSSTVQPETIHDFYNFPNELYQLSYPSPGAPETAARAAHLLREAGFSVDLDDERGLDHGAWIPLMLMEPEAQIPTLQLSIQSHLGPQHQHAVGQALAPLRREGVLILASGGAVHNLAGWRQGGDTTPAWALDFDDWLRQAVTEGRTDDLLNYRKRAPFAKQAHPRDEHLLPLFTALGAASEENPRGKSLYQGFSHRVLSMAAFGFFGDAG